MLPASWIGGAALAIVAMAATRASGHAVGPAVPLEEMVKTAELVCKAMVIAEQTVTDAWFEPIMGFEVRDTELRIVSIVKGGSGEKVVRFRHYAPAAGGAVGPSAVMARASSSTSAS